MITLVIFALLMAVMAWLIMVPVVSILARRLTISGSPLVRIRRILMVAGLPAAAAGLSMTALLTLAWGKWSGWIADHCLQHGAGPGIDHPHVCLNHLQAFAPTAAIVLVAAFLTLFMMRAVRWWRQQRQLRSEVRTLKSLSSGAGPLYTVDHSRPIAFATGIRRPRVIVSRGLRAELSKSERHIILGHELAHLRRHDPFWTAALELLLILHVSATASTLRSAWQQAVEERADDDVANRYGRNNTAAALARVARMMAGPRHQLSAAGGDVISRIQRLIDPQPASKSSISVELAMSLGLIGITAGVMAAHHPIETLFGLL